MRKKYMPAIAAAAAATSLLAATIIPTVAEQLPEKDSSWKVDKDGDGFYADAPENNYWHDFDDGDKNVHTAAELKARQESESIAAAESESRAAAESESIAAAESESRAAAESESRAAAESESIAAAESEPRAAAESESIAAAESESRAAAESESRAAEENEHTSETQLPEETLPTTEPQAVTETVTVTEAQQAGTEMSETDTETEAKKKKKKKKKQQTQESAQTNAGAFVGENTAAASGELYLAVSGYPVTSLTENEKSVYRFLRNDLGLNKAAAAGVLANIYCESNFSTVAIGDGGTSLGLCQWHLGRCQALIASSQTSGYDYRSVEGQLYYLKQELTGSYSAVYSYIQNVPDTVEGAYQAAYYFCMYFEAPSETATRSDARGKIATSTYYPADLDAMLDGSDELKVKSTFFRKTIEAEKMTEEAETQAEDSADQLSGVAGVAAAVQAQSALFEEDGEKETVKSEKTEETELTDADADNRDASDVAEVLLGTEANED